MSTGTMNVSRAGPRLGRSLLAAVIGCFGTAIAQADTLVNTPANYGDTCNNPFIRA